ncbi:SURF1 family protein [Pollutimonas sp. M17]|uniref:SURF1 family protein n=1 Tax=Pollutimonas sp. M17 TaxID=2962065 RepID=UPI0021F40E41|nr:SURF1 family protein [Pollutimonas sp. M17]UYO93613.1 SURF1 family protein [Pollutimonas sp. M17]HWK71587.1 SURF1 family protein [Burkholderiaceae bacterium]
MARPHTIFHTLTALVLLGALAFVFASLGNWQLGRAAQRDAIRLAIDAGRASAPLAIAAGTPATEMLPWRPATAHGRWRHDLTVLLENRNYRGRPGYWVATPLVIDEASGTAMLVLRGWLPRPSTFPQGLPQVPAAAGEQTVSGELLERVPRLFELWSWAGGRATQLPERLPDPNQATPRVQNLDLAAYAAATGLKFKPAVLAQTVAATPAGEAADGAQLMHEWPEPSLDSDKNRGYALQWFGFSAIAAIAWLVLAWRALRRRKSPPIL